PEPAPVARIEVVPVAAAAPPPGRRRTRWLHDHRAQWLPLLISILLAALAVGTVLVLVSSRDPELSIPVRRADSPAAPYDGPPVVDQGFDGNGLALALEDGDRPRQPACSFRGNPVRGTVARRTRSAPEAKRKLPRVVIGAPVPPAPDRTVDLAG